MNSDDILNQLVKGNDRYIAGEMQGHLGLIEKRKNLVVRQSPVAVVLSCTDSRIVPEYIFDVSPGVIYVVRIAGNISNTEVIASIEFAIATLDPKLLIVMGHENCGAVQVSVEGEGKSEALNRLISRIKPAITGISENDLSQAVENNVVHVATELTSKSNIISEALKTQKIKLVKAFYHLSSGKVDFI